MDKKNEETTVQGGSLSSVYLGIVWTVCKLYVKRLLRLEGKNSGAELLFILFLKDTWLVFFFPEGHMSTLFLQMHLSVF